MACCRNPCVSDIPIQFHNPLLSGMSSKLRAVVLKYSGASTCSMSYLYLVGEGGINKAVVRWVLVT